jgi:Zn-dependent protease with chaperone function
MIWTGHYLDGRSAGRRPARVRITGSGLEILTDDGGVRRWPFAEIRQTQGRYAGEPVRLERGGEAAEALIVGDLALLTALREVTASHRGRFHDPRRRRLRAPLTLVAGLAALGLGGGLYAWGIPALAGLAVWLVPVSWEVRLGQEIFARLVQPEDRCADPERQRVIETVLARLTHAGSTGPYQLRVTVVDRPEVNALALPGGHIVVLRGLLDLTDSAEMLAGVLAHEAQHVLRRHTTRAIIQHASTSLMVGAIAGDVSGLVTFALEGARVIAELSYSRQAEEEADVEGLRMLTGAGISPAAMIKFFDRIGPEDEVGEPQGIRRYLSTHPTGRERAAALRRLAGQAPVTPRLLADYDWKDVKRICGA